MESWKVGVGFAHQPKSRVFTLLEANKSTSFLLLMQRIIIHQFFILCKTLLPLLIFIPNVLTGLNAVTPYIYIYFFKVSW